MNFSKLDELMRSLPLRGIPAAELAVTHQGKTVYRTGVGFSDAAGTKPVTDRDLYWIFSATKVMTCVAAMKLVEEGKIALDDPVAKYISEFANLTVRQKDGTLIPAQSTMTILHLFTMSAGLSYDFNTQNIREAKESNPTTLGLVRAMAKDPLLFEPGTHYKYSLCHDVLAAVVEVASGMRFSDYLDRLIFKPLGMTDTGFQPNEEQRSRFTDMYTYRGGTKSALLRECVNNYALSPDYESGGAGLFSRVDDYIKAVTCLATGKSEDGYTILKPETVAMMQKNYLCDDALNDFVTTRLHGYGWGLCGRVHTDPFMSMGRAPIGEFGWDGAAGAFTMVDTENKIALYFGMHVRSCQYVYHVIHPMIRNLVYEGIFD
jgi:CubicO group peptidase (beta-lactamase class C family)